MTKLVLCTGIVIAPFVAFQVYGREQYCSDRSLPERRWCRNSPLLPYSFVQAEYWSVRPRRGHTPLLLTVCLQGCRPFEILHRPAESQFPSRRTRPRLILRFMRRLSTAPSLGPLEADHTTIHRLEQNPRCLGNSDTPLLERQHASSRPPTRGNFMPASICQSRPNQPQAGGHPPRDILVHCGPLGATGRNSPAGRRPRWIASHNKQRRRRLEA